MEIKYSKTFLRQYQKVDIKIRQQFEKRLALFFKNPQDPKLRNHRLAGRLKAFRSINITGDFRVLYSESMEKERIVIFFESIGTHSQLYK